MPKKKTKKSKVYTVTIFHYLAVAVAELAYFETCGFPFVRHNVDYVLQTCFHA